MNHPKVVQLSKRFIQTVKPHAPLIRFRKGSAEDGKTSDSSHNASSSKSGSSRPTIEDYQLPTKYRRRLLDESEINAINSGGVF